MWRAFAPAVSLLCLVLGPSVALAQGQKPGVSPRVPPALAALHAAHALHLATTPRLPFRPVCCSWMRSRIMPPLDRFKAFAWRSSHASCPGSSLIVNVRTRKW